MRQHFCIGFNEAGHPASAHLMKQASNSATYLRKTVYAQLFQIERNKECSSMLSSNTKMLYLHKRLEVYVESIFILVIHLPLFYPFRGQAKIICELFHLVVSVKFRIYI